MFKVPFCYLIIFYTSNIFGQISSYEALMRDKGIASESIYDMVIIDGKESGDSVLKIQDFYNRSGFRTKTLAKFESGTTTLSDYELKFDTICVRIKYTSLPGNFVRATEYMHYDKKGRLSKVYEKRGKSKKLKRQIWYDVNGMKSKITYFNKNKNTSTTIYQYSGGKLNQETLYRNKEKRQTKTLVYNQQGDPVLILHSYEQEDTIHYPKGRCVREEISYENGKRSNEIRFLENGKSFSQTTYAYTKSHDTLTKYTQLDSNYVVYSGKTRPINYEKQYSHKEISLNNSDGVWYKYYEYRNDKLKTVRVRYFTYFD